MAFCVFINPQRLFSNDREDMKLFEEYLHLYLETNIDIILTDFTSDMKHYAGILKLITFTRRNTNKKK